MLTSQENRRIESTVGVTLQVLEVAARHTMKPITGLGEKELEVLREMIERDPLSPLHEQVLVQTVVQDSNRKHF